MRRMTRRWFGTDGVRGVAGVAPMRAEDAFALGCATTERLREAGRSRPAIVSRTDPRVSSEMLSRAFSAGALSRGANVTDVGVLPTPGVAFLARHVQADAGVVISASHNPFHDNGVKLFDGNGEKLSDAEELAIEAWLERDATAWNPVQGADVGRLGTLNGSRDGYVAFLLDHAPYLDGMRIGLDCANGAASVVAPQVCELTP
jgi:Phosphomannomutase